MSNFEEASIELSRTKMILALAGCIAFLAGGVWMLSLDDEWIRLQHNPFWMGGNPTFVHGIGLAAILLSALGCVFYLRKLFDRKPGLQLTRVGIVDNASGIAAGLIPWSEIIGFEIFQVRSQRFLVVRVTNPEKYVEVGSPIRRALNRANHKMCGSPIAISSNALKTDFNGLVDLITNYRSNYSRIA